MSKKLTVGLNARLLFDIFLIIFALVFFFNSLDLAFRPWLFPGSFSIILLLMASIQTLMDWNHMRNASTIAEPALTAATTEEVPGQKRKVVIEGQYARLGIAVLSMAGFYIIFRFATIYIAIPILCVLLLRYLGGRSWRMTSILALGMDGFVYVCFQWLLQTSL